MKDPVYFMERYVLINNEHIKLKPYQKKLLRKLYKK